MLTGTFYQAALAESQFYYNTAASDDERLHISLTMTIMLLGYGKNRFSN